MNRVVRLVVGLALALMLPVAASAAGDPFLGTWRLNKAKSIIATDPGVKSKTFVFAPSADGVMISETLEMLPGKGEGEVAQIPYAYGKSTLQTRRPYDHLLVVKGDDRTAYWTALAKGEVVAQMQVNVSDDGRRMTFRYLWSAGDPTGKAFNDRYVYVKE